MSAFALAMGAIALLRRRLRLPPFGFDPSRHRIPLALAVAAGIAVSTHLDIRTRQIDVVAMWDGWQSDMLGRSLASGRGPAIDGRPSHHSPPLYPLCLPAFHSIDSGEGSRKLAVEVAFLISLLTVFVVTRWLHDLDWALAAAAVVPLTWLAVEAGRSGEDGGAGAGR